MSKIRLLIVLGALLVLGAVNFSIYGKERIKREGEIIYLDLMPKDPRSLMQGDYMTLRFRLAQEIDAAILHPQDSTSGALLTQADRTILTTGRGRPLPPREGQNGIVLITLDEKRIAHLVGQPTSNTLKLRYRVRKNTIWLGTNGFFFEEGSAQRYESARYGEFRLDLKSGEAVLVGLRGARMEAL